MRILGLDLGTKTGWAVQDDDLFLSGTWQLATPAEVAAQAKAGKNRCCDCRFMRLQKQIALLAPLDAVYFEDVEFSTYTYQTQLWAGFRTVLTLMYPAHFPKLVAVPVATLKKFATGKGNSTKSAMADGLYMCRFPSPQFFEGASEAQIKQGKFLVQRMTQRPLDDNEIDAIHLLRYGMRQEAQ